MKSILEKKALMERMHLLIKKSGTGNPSQFAKRLEISKASLHRHLEYMKVMGAPIYYSINRETYAYEYEVEFQFGFQSVTGLKKHEKKKINGGQPNKHLNIFSTFFSSLNI